MIKRFFFSLIALLSLFTFVSCEKEIDERETDELLRLQAYIKVQYHFNNIQIDSTSSGLYYIVHEEGTGNSPKKGNYLSFTYTGMNLDNIVFETSVASTAILHDIYSPRTYFAPRYQMYQNDLKPMIKGLDEGLGMLKIGGKARFILPSKLAYGSGRYKGLHPFSSVIYDIELHEIILDPEAHEQAQIQAYLAENYSDQNPEEMLVDGIYILLEDVAESELPIDDEEYDGPLDIEEGDVVKLHYTGSLLDGWIFDTNDIEVAQENNIYDSGRTYTPLEVEVGGTGFIEGFSLALQNLKTKSEVIILIPSEFAYKIEGNETIPAYAPLIFKLKILSKTTPGTGSQQ